jgi:hypothetical protein
MARHSGWDDGRLVVFHVTVVMFEIDALTR